jgi:uncharacterized protein (TIGR02453 family)
MSLQTTLDFLEALSNNNNKAWFDENRKQYDLARTAFELLIANIVTQFHHVDDIGNLMPKDAIHRINRDIRFSKDKSPYNTSMSALIGLNGRKSMSRAYYIRVAPQNQSLVASGVIELSGAELQTIRTRIAEDSQPLRAIIESETFQRYFGTLNGERVKTAPNGFPIDHPDIDLLRYKEFLAEHTFADAEVTQDDFVERVIAVCRAARPLTLYFDQLLGERVKSERGKH